MLTSDKAIGYCKDTNPPGKNWKTKITYVLSNAGNIVDAFGDLKQNSK